MTTDKVLLRILFKFSCLLTSVFFSGHKVYQITPYFVLYNVHIKYISLYLFYICVSIVIGNSFFYFPKGAFIFDIMKFEIFLVINVSNIFSHFLQMD